ncbi:MAG TPA: hypothetical protein VM287_04260 [Egibacteraceae bacterium]|nr:hypothetical protein [Egibacteraceae bacterium]
MRGLPAVAAVALVFAAVTVLAPLVGGSSGGYGPTLHVPAPGQAEAGVLTDGEPVFVVAHPGGDVGVVSAVGSHLDVLVVWCGDARQFVEPGGASHFDAHGRYLSGPAPVGLASFDTTVKGDVVGVGARRPHPPRDTDISHGSQSDCIGSEGFRGGLSHDDEPVTVEEIAWARTGRFVTVEGLLDLSSDTARLCTARPATRVCPPDAPVVGQSFNAGFRSFDLLAAFDGWMQGTFVARVLPGRKLTDVAMRLRFVEEWEYNFTYGGAF